MGPVVDRVSSKPLTTRIGVFYRFAQETIMEGKMGVLAGFLRI